MDKTDSEFQVKEELRVVDVNKISVNPYQPRREFDQAELEDLAQSIKILGLLHPPLVRSLPDTDEFELISGERRYRASRLAGLKQIPVVVRNTTYTLSAQAALVENIQRVDLNPLEISKAIRRLMIEFNFSQDDLANRLGKKRSTVANYLRLLSLPIHIQEGLLKERITMGHAKAILSLEGSEKQNLLYEIVLRDDLNVRETEKAALRINEKSKKNKLKYATRDFYLEGLAEKIQERLGTKVIIQSKGKKGRLCIDYYNYDDLDRLLDLFGVNQTD